MMAQPVLFSVFKVYVICKWSDFNDPHTNVTLIFLKYDVVVLKSVGHLDFGRKTNELLSAQ